MWPGPVTGERADIPSHEGWSDWWASTANTAVGSYWLRVDAGTFDVFAGAATTTINETSSQEDRADALGDERPCTRSHQVRGSTAGRRGGHIPRPPPAATTATTSVDIDLTNSGYELMEHLVY